MAGKFLWNMEISEYVLKNMGEGCLYSMIVTSGFQTGVDIAAIFAAHKAGLMTYGHTVKGFLNESGYQPNQKIYGAIDDCVSYKQRTERNVMECNICLVITNNLLSLGTKCTIHFCKKYKKPLKKIHVNFDESLIKSLKFDDIVKDILNGLIKHNPPVLLVAGNRESIAPGIQLWTEILLFSVFSQYKKFL